MQNGMETNGIFPISVYPEVIHTKRFMLFNVNIDIKYYMFIQEN